MTTPPSPKRFDLEEWKRRFFHSPEGKSGSYTLALANDEAAIEFALFVSGFTHLETSMEWLAAELLGTTQDTAAHIMRSIVSAKGRIDLLTKVLERSRHNSEKSVEFDIVIREFTQINRIRNSYVHAKYQTDETGRVFWVKPDGDPLLVERGAWEPFDIKELRKARESMSGLWIKIARVLAIERERAEAYSKQP